MEFKRIGERDIEVNSFQDVVLKEKTCYCPHCGAGPMDGLGGARFSNKYDPKNENIKADPKSGDITICMYCAELCVFEKTEKGLIMKIPSEQQMDKIQSDDGKWNVLQGIMAKIKLKISSDE